MALFITDDFPIDMGTGLQFYVPDAANLISPGSDDIVFLTPAGTIETYTGSFQFDPLGLSGGAFTGLSEQTTGGDPIYSLSGLALPYA